MDEDSLHIAVWNAITEYIGMPPNELVVVVAQRGPDEWDVRAVLYGQAVWSVIGMTHEDVLDHLENNACAVGEKMRRAAKGPARIGA